MDYKERYFNQLLDTIHYVIRINNQFLTEEEMEETDKKIISYLMDKFDHEESKARVLKGKTPGNVHNNDLLDAVTMYFAITQDNEELLEELKEKDFNFNGADTNINLYALDRNLSSKFAKDLYLKLLLEQPQIMKRYYTSLHFATPEEKEESMRDFAEILTANPDICHRAVIRNRRDNMYNNLLTYRNIEYFGKDFLIKANDSQKEVINELRYYLEAQDIIKIKELLEKHPHYKMKTNLDSVILNSFTADEIAAMPLKDCILYEAARCAGVFERMQEILKLDPSFNCRVDFIRPEIFKCLDNETILGLTERAKIELAELDIPKTKEAVIFPYRKINRIVVKDNRRKKKEEKKGFQKTK